MSEAVAAGADFEQRAKDILAEKFAPWVQDLHLGIESANPIVLRLANRAALTRVGGMLCGQALMAAADTAMVLAISEALGGFMDMATINMTCNFLAAVVGEDALIETQITRLGKSLAFGDVRIFGAGSGKLCMHSTLTYTVIRK